MGLTASNFAAHCKQLIEFMVNLLLPAYTQDITHNVHVYKFNNTYLLNYTQKHSTMIGKYLREGIDLDLVLLNDYIHNFSGSVNNK